MSNKLRIKNHSATFIQKLVALLQDENSLPYAHWIQGENGFNITNNSGFTQNVLPLYFKHQNFSSFVRQLNMYGFTKVRSKDGDNIYQNPNFKRGSRISLKKIQRKDINQAQKQQRIVPYNEHHICIRNTESQIQKVKEKQVLLQKRCVDLIQKNKQLLNENEKIVQAIRHEQKKREKLINQILSIINSAKPQNQVKSIQNTEYHHQENAQNKKQQEYHLIDESREKGIHFLDPNQEFLTLDDFLNISCDDLSQCLKI